MIYTAVLEREVNGQFSVHLPAFRGVDSSGSTRHEALARVVEAAELWMDVERGLKREVPSHDSVAILAEGSRVIADQRADGRDPQLELVSVAVHSVDREVA